MKQLKTTSLVIGFLTIIILVVAASSAHAQELVIIENGEVLQELNLPEKTRETVKAPRVTVDIGYVGGDLVRSIQFPSAPRPNLNHGHEYIVNGIDIGVAANVTKVVTIVGRYQRKALSNAQNFTDIQIGDLRGRHSEPDTSASGQKTDYIEVASRLKLPKTHGHSLLVGVARTTTERHWRYEDVFGGIYGGEDRDEYLGLVYGVEGAQKLRSLTFNYGVRSYYHLMLRENDAVNKLPASGYELGGSVTWTIHEHLGVRGGYEFRRLHTEVGTTPFESEENNDDHGPIVALRLSF